MTKHSISFKSFLAIYITFSLLFHQMPLIDWLTAIVDLSSFSGIYGFLFIEIINVLLWTILLSLSFFISPIFGKLLSVILLNINAAAAFWMSELGIILNQEILVSIFYTDFSEASGFLNQKFALQQIFLGILPSVLFGFVTVEPLKRTKVLLYPALSLVTLVIVCISNPSLTSWLSKNDGHLGARLLPWSYIANSIRYAQDMNEGYYARYYGDFSTLPDGTMVTKDDPRRVKDSVVAHLPEAERADAKKAVILSNNLNMRMNDLRTLANEAGRKAKNFEESGENIGAELERIEQKRLIGKFEELRAMDIDLKKEFPLKRDAPKVAPKVGTGMPMSMPTGSDPTGVNKATGSANAATPTNLSTGASPTGKGKSGVASSGLAKKLAEIQAKRKALQSKRKTLGGGRGLSKEMQEAMGGRYPSMDGQTNIVDAKGQASLAQGKIESANLMRQENEIKLMMDAGKSSSADGKGGTTVVNNVSAPQNSSVTTTGRSGSNTIKNNKYGRLNINLPGSGLDM